MEELRKATPKSLWMRDLEAFLKQLDAQELEEAKVAGGTGTTRLSAPIMARVHADEQ